MLKLRNSHLLILAFSLWAPSVRASRTVLTSNFRVQGFVDAQKTASGTPFDLVAASSVYGAPIRLAFDGTVQVDLVNNSALLQTGTFETLPALKAVVASAGCFTGGTAVKWDVQYILCGTAGSRNSASSKTGAISIPKAVSWQLAPGGAITLSAHFVASGKFDQNNPNSPSSGCSSVYYSFEPIFRISVTEDLGAVSATASYLATGVNGDSANVCGVDSLTAGPWWGGYIVQNSQSNIVINGGRPF